MGGAAARTCVPILYRFDEACITACSSSCGETWPLKLYGDQTLRTRAPNSATSGDVACA